MIFLLHKFRICIMLSNNISNLDHYLFISGLLATFMLLNIVNAFERIIQDRGTIQNKRYPQQYEIGVEEWGIWGISHDVITVR